MPGSLTIASKPPSFWALNLTILQASSVPREAPWYGAWNIVLKEMFQEFCPRKFNTVTYPQFPLVKDIDTVDISASEDEESDEERADQAGVYLLLLC
jgi:hypothetical protein